MTLMPTSGQLHLTPQSTPSPIARPMILTDLSQSKDSQMYPCLLLHVFILYNLFFSYIKFLKSEKSHLPLSLFFYFYFHVMTSQHRITPSHCSMSVTHVLYIR